MSFLSKVKSVAKKTASVAKKATKVVAAPVKVAAKVTAIPGKVAAKAISIAPIPKVLKRPLANIAKIATAPSRVASKALGATGKVIAGKPAARKPASPIAKVMAAASPTRATAAPRKVLAPAMARAVVRASAPSPIKLPSVAKIIAAASPSSAVAMDDPPPADEPIDVTPEEPGSDDPYAAPDDGSDAHAPAPANFDGSPHEDSDFAAGPADDSDAADYEGAEVEHEEGDPMALGDIDYAAAFAGIDDVDNSAQLYGLGDWKADLKNIGKSAAQGAAITGGTAALNMAISKLSSSDKAQAIAAGVRGAAGEKPKGMTDSTKIAIGAAVALPVLYLLAHHKKAS